MDELIVAVMAQREKLETRQHKTNRLGGQQRYPFILVLHSSSFAPTS